MGDDFRGKGLFEDRRHLRDRPRGHVELWGLRLEHHHVVVLAKGAAYAAAIACGLYIVYG